MSDDAIARLQSAMRWPEFPGERYTAISEIGRGGMGTVYLGRDADLSRDVAIKVSAQDARMRREAKVLAGLEHPGIVPVHDVGALADGRVFAVMMLVRGATLDDHIRTISSRAERLRIFERLCEPVAFAHARRTVHCDLKPGNVMVGAFGEVLVMDWGLAKTTGDERDEGDEGKASGGTEGYMAPEQAAGEWVDARTDVFALGVILKQLIDGFPADKRLNAIVAKASAARADERYADAAQLGADVARLREGLPVEAWPEGVLDRVMRFTSRYRAPILLILTYIVIRVVIAAVFRR